MLDAENIATMKQPAPAGDGSDVTAQVIRDLEARKVVGLAKYGTVLKTNNGRDPLIDAYQEALDLVLYLRQAILERDDQMRKAERLVAELDDTLAELGDM